MATVPQLSLPSVGQSDTLAIQPNPRAFGASVVGEGLSGLGQATQQHADVLQQHALQFQALNNKAAADQSTTNMNQEIDSFETDQRTNNVTFYAEHPVEAAAQAADKIEAIRTAHRQNLTNPAAQAIYDNDSRRNASLAFSRMSGFASQANQTWFLQTQQGIQQSAISQIVADPSQLPTSGIGAPDGPWAKYLEAEGAINLRLGKPGVKAEADIRELYGKVVGSVTDLMSGSGDIQGAHDFLEAHKDQMSGETYRSASVRLAPALMSNNIASIARQAHDDVVGNGTSAGAPGATISPVPEGAQPTGSFGEHRAATATTPAHIHEGQDYAVGMGTPIGSARAGTVVSVGPMGGYGLTTVVDYGSGLYGLTGHLSASDLHPGDQVAAGQRVGASGKSGNATGPSVHLEFRQAPAGGPQDFAHARPIDPAQVLGHATSSVNSRAGGALTSAQLAAQEGAVADRAEQLVRNSGQPYANNEEVIARARTNAISLLGQDARLAANREKESAATLYNAIEQGGYQTQEELFQHVPGAATAYNALPESQATGLHSAFAYNANHDSAERLNNFRIYKGQATEAEAGNDDSFLHLNPYDPAIDLRRADRIALFNEQQRIQAQRDRSARSDNLMFSPVSKSQLNLYLDKAHIQTNTPQYHYLLGAVHDELNQFQAGHTNKVPSFEDWQAIYARAFAATAQAHVGFSGAPDGSYRAPAPELVAAARQALIEDQHIRDPTDEQIGAYINQVARFKESQNGRRNR